MPRLSRGPQSRRRGTVRPHPLVGVLGGSKSDFPILEKAVAILTDLGIPHELMVVSAHRTPDRLFAYAEQAPGRGIEVIIAGAGGAAQAIDFGPNGMFSLTGFLEVTFFFY